MEGTGVGRVIPKESRKFRCMSDPVHPDFLVMSWTCTTLAAFTRQSYARRCGDCQEKYFSNMIVFFVSNKFVEEKQPFCCFSMAGISDVDIYIFAFAAFFLFG